MSRDHTVQLRNDLIKRRGGHRVRGEDRTNLGRCEDPDTSPIDGPAVIVWNRSDSRIAFRCGVCGGKKPDAIAEGVASFDDCRHCGDVGWIGVDPAAAVDSTDRTVRAAMYRSRYVAGLPIFDQRDVPFVSGQTGGTPDDDEV